MTSRFHRRTCPGGPGLLRAPAEATSTAAGQERTFCRFAIRLQADPKRFNVLAQKLPGDFDDGAAQRPIDIEISFPNAPHNTAMPSPKARMMTNDLSAK